MTQQTQETEGSHRLPVSDDLEVSAYLELAREKAGEAPAAVEASDAGHETIVVIDFGSQYSMLIARRVRELSVYCEVVPHTAPWEQIEKLNPKGFILSGGPSSVFEESAPLAPTWAIDSRRPVLGICYGMQLLAHQLGGKVAPSGAREYGPAVIYKADADGASIFTGLPSSMPVWMSHGDKVTELPEGFQTLASSDNSPVAAMGNHRGVIGIQFHPEVVHTPQGKEMLRNFLFNVCGCRGTWTAGNFVQEQIDLIRAQIGDGKVICALSGGVDSAVAATLVHRAVGDQLTCIFVNNGLLRREEPERVRATFERSFKMNLVYADAVDRFLAALEGVTNPEIKRKLVGQEFIRVFEQEAVPLGKIDFIVQGTTYPDVIESAVGTGVAAKIKTHHNVGGLPKRMVFKLVEPLRYLFKDEVRRVGLELGLPDDMVYRQPFPGPGLAIRVIGEVTEEKLDTLRAADWIVMDEVKKAGMYYDLWQVFAVLTDTRSVGVMGDYRTYGHVAAIRAVTAEDAMTADWARLPYDLLARISNRIVNEVPAVNRVVYDITSKPPGTIEWE